MLGSVWLISPNKKIKQIIKKLSRDFNTPVFLPHITLINGFRADEEKLFLIKKALSKKINNKKRMILKVKNLDYSDKFTKTLFLTFYNNNELYRLRKDTEEIFKNLNLSFNQEFLPHLSLIYKNLDEKTKKELAKKIKPVLPKSIQLNKTEIILEEKPIEKPEDIKNWKFFK